MLEGCKTAQERWGGVHVIIDRWLDQRRQLVEMWTYLRERGDFTPTDTPSIQRFCELLVDYVSAGHFTVYEQLALEAKEFHDDGAVVLLNTLLPLVDESTQIVLEFHDKYDTKQHCNSQLEALPFSLQALTLVMMERFQYEDQLIEELHEAHSEESA
ncbi:sigma D regulator [Marinomonas algarum]|uniref:Sigma D regulator n=1 Tax=Marinomonas algarum TaxID=2883105 RepID=A0A9X1IMW0_9GAMM|nr:sigma D regulator [Marinomonas algarum]MCB5161241.1 sigma D regulator [Marinomonas algarum]